MSPVYGAFREAVLGPPFTAGDAAGMGLEPGLPGFSRFGFSHPQRLKPEHREIP